MERCIRAREGFEEDLKLTCTMSAAWAGSSGLRQEYFQASSCHDSDTPWTLTSYYEVCLKACEVTLCAGFFCRCWLTHLSGSGGISEIIIVGNKLFSSRNQAIEA